MRSSLFVILISFVSSCAAPIPDVYKISEKEQLANQVIRQAFSQLRKEKDLEPFGEGGQMMHQIQMLALSFSYYKPLDIEQAREMLIYVSTTFLDIINKNEKIRPYLDNYPFDLKNIEIRIVVRGGDKSDPDKLVFVSMHRGVLGYDIREFGTILLKEFYRETYEEAVERLAYQNEQSEKKY
jgi:hypothetical protein